MLPKSSQARIKLPSPLRSIVSYYFFVSPLRVTRSSTSGTVCCEFQSWRMMIKINENMSVLYMAYQLLLFVSSMLTPATIFLLIVGAINTAFQEIDLMQALFINLAPVVIFLVICLTARSKIQVRGRILPGGYRLGKRGNCSGMFKLNFSFSVSVALVQNAGEGR